MTRPDTSDYFAELYVAGRFAEEKWNIYFPHRDEGFDFIVSKRVNGVELLRPVQVKGKYPTSTKGNHDVYGFTGSLSRIHPEMVLAIPFFSVKSREMPVCTAYIPNSLIRKLPKAFRCLPASIKEGEPKPRRDYARFFGRDGLKQLESPSWGQSVGV